MKCPNCDFIDKDKAFGDPAVCPQCGAIYEKALRLKANRESQEPIEKQRQESQGASEGVSLKSRLASAAASVSDGRERRAEASTQSQQNRESRSVIVTDIDMPFWSMVFFMVKWVIASIPAIIILVLLAVGIPAFLRALLGGIM